MAAPSSTHINQVLHSYKREAMKNLHGPGAQEHLLDSRKLFTDDGYNYKFKKAMLYCDPPRKIKPDPFQFKKCDDFICSIEKSAAGIWPSAKTPADAVLRHSGSEQSIEHQLLQVTPINTTQASILKSESNKSPPDKSRINDQSCKGATDCKDSSSGACDTKKRLDNSGNENNSKSHSNWEDSRGSRSATSFSTQPWPVLASADPDELPPGRSETVLESEPIACFNIGGEPRLCLAQILNSVLQNFQLIQIYAVCDDLHIYCKNCSPRQLINLKNTGVLPPSAPSCGLITKTDAQRLIHALRYSQLMRPSLTKSNPNGKHSLIPRLRVSHNCFGKGKGLLWPDFYLRPSDPCIECLDCRNMYSPKEFVCHAHRALENRTCHWGFDADNWRCYLMLSRDQSMNQQKAISEMNAFKAKFDWSSTANHKRKQKFESKDELLKKVRSEDVSISGYESGIGNYAFSSPYASATTVPGWQAVPIIKEGKSICHSPIMLKERVIPTNITTFLNPAHATALEERPNLPVQSNELDTSHKEPLDSSTESCSIKGESEKENFEQKPLISVVLSPQQRPAPNSSGCLENITIKSECDSPKEGLLVRVNSCEDVVRRDELLIVKVERGMENSTLILKSPRSPINVSLPLQHQTSKSPTNSPGKADSPSLYSSLGRQTSSPERRTLPPDLELSTTDSDTESVTSVSSKSEIVEEAEALLRGWNDRAAAKKVLDLVSSLAGTFQQKEKQAEEALNDKVRLQQIMKSEQESKPSEEESQKLKEKVSSLEKEVQMLRQLQSPKNIKLEGN